jgi:filamentous hemagglutinin family protein
METTMALRPVFQPNHAGWASAIGATLLAFYPIATLAQVVGDGTLGTQVNGAAIAPCTGDCIITDGAIRGSNLFHSFQQFSLPNGDFADFITAPITQNVIVRVTGVGQPFISNINGTIQTSNPTNFFLLNPNGIIFGPGATLNIGGAFLATTASRMQFADGTEFRTNSPAPLLTISVPIGLQFNGTPGNIQMQGSFLSTGRTDSFSDFALIGGQVSLDNAILSTPGQRVELGGLVSTGNVGLMVTNNRLRLELPNSVTRADVSLANRSIVSVQAQAEGGDVVIHAHNLNILGGSGILAGIAQGSGSPTTQAGDILLDATGTINLVNSVIGNGLRQGAEGQSGDVLVRTRSLILSDNASIGTVTQGRGGKAGNIDVKADLVSLTGRSTALLSNVAPNAAGQGGDIRIETRFLSLQDGAGLTASTFGQGNAGNIDVQASDAISLLNGQIFSRVNAGGVGRGGDITIQAGTLSLEGENAIVTTDVSAPDNFDPAGRGRGGDIKIQTGGFIALKHGAAINTSTSGEGSAGNINLQTEGFISLVDSNIFALVDEGAVGQGGDITIRANSIALKEDGPLVSSQTGIASSTFGQGDSGAINIRVTDAISLAGTGGFITGVGEGAVGNGGNIRVEAQSLVVTDGAQLFANTFGGGDAGSIQVNASNSILLSGAGVTTGFASGFQTDTQEGAVGRSGNINVTTRSLSILNGAVLSAGTQSSFNGGSVTVTADTVDVTDSGRIRTSTDSSGNAGNITFSVRDRTALSGNDSGLFASTEPGSTGKGGTITLQTRSLSLLNNAQITGSTAGQGDAGSINVTADTLETTSGGQVRTATERSGNAGNITLRVSDRILVTGQNSGLVASTAPGSTGTAGSVDIATTRLEVRDGARLTGSTSGAGQAGTVTIAANSLEVSQGGQIRTTTESKGNAGDITLRVSNRTALSGNGSGLFASTEPGSTGKGGTITLQTRSLSLLNNAQITGSTAGQGDAGSINVTGDTLETTSGGQIRTATGVTVMQAILRCE